jgi:hypothetical protein
MLAFGLNKSLIIFGSVSHVMENTFANMEYQVNNFKATYTVLVTQYSDKIAAYNYCNS